VLLVHVSASPARDCLR